METNLTIIQLSQEDAKLFLDFQKHYRFIKFLEDNGAFQMKQGYLTLHFSKLGEIITFDLVETKKVFQVPQNAL